MLLDFVRRTVRDVDAAAVGLPSGNARGELLVGVGDTAVVLFLVFVLDGVRRGIAPQPELLDELLALFVGLQPLESLALFIGDDVDRRPRSATSGKEFRALCAASLRAASVPFRSGASPRSRAPARAASFVVRVLGSLGGQQGNHHAERPGKGQKLPHRYTPPQRGHSGRDRLWLRVRTLATYS